MAADASLVRAIRGPITLITLGVLFTFDHFTPYSFSQTWPVLLIVFGLLSLLRRGISPPPGPPIPPFPPQGGQPWGTAAGTGSAYSTGGGYRQSTYGNLSSSGGSGQPTGPGNPGDNPAGTTGGSQ
ncbi:MAG: LiaI-LiaF-like domain-containing protein [Bryobacteraceae bacterium]